MNTPYEKGLLPAGLADILPPDAAYESNLAERLVACFSGYGYARVEPPLIEFEDALLEGPGEALSAEMFRVMDPVSQRMMGVRTDITLQVARIAGTRLAKAARPLRLSYSGHVLRVRGSQLRPERQFRQVGVELIGPERLAADGEVVLLAARALEDLGARDLSFDLTVPLLVPSICRELGLDAESAAAARTALDRKDTARLAHFDKPVADVFRGLALASGPAEAALETLAGLDLAEQSAEIVANLRELVGHLHGEAPDLHLTIDPGEFRGLEYQTGISFTVFARGVRGELGRGGRYHLQTGEPATGFTLFMDSLLRAVPAAPAADLVYAPFATTGAEVVGLRAEGRSIVQGLEPERDVEAEARRLGCSLLLDAGSLRPLD